MKPVITRFAPSPTGDLHIGGVRTALMNYIYAKQHNGAFLLRIDDTDKKRSKSEYEKSIIDSLEWLGIRGMGPLLRQSEREDIYETYILKLIHSGNAYISKETPTEEGQRDEVIRFKNPNKVITFTDIVRGTISVDTTDLGDFVIARSLKEPVYHLAVVIDDYESEVTHVIRASEHISNTPRQILLLEAIGAPQPTYAHLPLILGKDGKKKLSKRDGAANVIDYKNEGFLPSALINYLTLIGWHPSENDQEIFSLEEIITLFDLSKVQKGGGMFDIEKFKWINREHILRLSNEEFLELAQQWLPDSLIHNSDWSQERFAKAIPFIKERTYTLKDITTMAQEGEFDFIFQQPIIHKESLHWKKSTPKEAKLHLTHLKTLLQTLPESSSSETVSSVLMPYADEKGRGDVLWPLRYALSGKEKSPGPFEIIGIIGVHESVNRIEHASHLIHHDES